MSNKQMSLPALLTEYLTPQMTELGFELRKPRQGVWMFVRTPFPEFEQQIIVYRDPHQTKLLHCQYSTTDVPVVGTADTELQRRLPHGGYAHDEDSLRRVLMELRSIIVSDGIPKIEQVGGPFPRPTEAQARTLLDQPEQWAHRCMNQLGLATLDLESLGAIERAILKAAAEQHEPAWELLLGAAGYMGELVRSTLGGRWEWEGYRQTPRIAGLSLAFGIIYPLRTVCEAWYRQTPDALTSYCQHLLSKRRVSQG